MWSRNISHVRGSCGLVAVTRKMYACENIVKRLALTVSGRPFIR